MLIHISGNSFEDAPCDEADGDAQPSHGEGKINIKCNSSHVPRPSGDLAVYYHYL